MSTAPSVQHKQTQANNRARQATFLTVGLSVATTVLFALKFYFVRELLTFLATMAVLFAVGTGVLLFLVVLQEIGRWIVVRMGAAKHVTVFSGRTRIAAELTKCAVPEAIAEESGI